MKEFASPSSFQNIFIACFTTTHARLKLYSLLDILQDRAIYCDTDSVVYSAKHGEEELPLGDYLGDLTNELNPGDHIVKFVSSGPKAYSYVTLHGDTCTKLKGFTLNYTNSEKIHYDSMNEMVSEGGHITTTNPNKIFRSKYTSSIFNVHEEKRYKMVYDKRRIQPDMSTLPYGYTKTS